MSSVERNEAPTKKTSGGFSIDFKALGPFLALVGLFVLGTAINDAFLSGGNLSNIFTRAAFIGIIAV
ncbi:MAG TPA: ABC transporter permease, partial [Thalassospira lucentensis]|nr:ABC transporter permease [Thalassospira lucentensis]